MKGFYIVSSSFQGEIFDKLLDFLNHWQVGNFNDHNNYNFNNLWLVNHFFKNSFNLIKASLFEFRKIKLWLIS